MKLWGSVPSKGRQKHTVPRACPHPGTTLPISPGGGGGRAWGEGLPQGPLGSVVYWDCPLHAPHSQVGQGKEARRVRLSALCLTSLSLKLTGFSVVRSLNGRAASVFPLSTSRPPSSVCLRALPCSGPMCACLCLCAPDLCLTLSAVCAYSCLFVPVSTLVLSLCVFAFSGSLLFAFMQWVSSLTLWASASPPHPPPRPQPPTQPLSVCFYVQSSSHLHPPSFSKLRRKTSKRLSISIPNLFSSSCGRAEEGITESPKSGRHLGRGGVPSRTGGAMR